MSKQLKRLKTENGFRLYESGVNFFQLIRDLKGKAIRIKCGSAYFPIQEKHFLKTLNENSVSFIRANITNENLYINEIEMYEKV